MIKIDDKEIKIEKFPDGTPRINIDIDKCPLEKNKYSAITWLYENNEELMYLIMIKNWLDDQGKKAYLKMPYVPNGRMDRTKNPREVFTLKYFCWTINSLNFERVYTLDNHSDVSTALLNRCVNRDPKDYIGNVIRSITDTRNPILYFPDAGAAKRYSGLFSEIPYCYGEKKRDWNTGEILGLDIKANGNDLKDKVVIMIDDIIAYGGSLYYSARELKKYDVKKIYAYATHTENSVLDTEKGTLIKALEDDTVQRLFTTNSLFSGSHKKITVMEV